MKKLTSILLAMLMLFSLFAFAGCSSDMDSHEKSSENEKSSEFDPETDNPVATMEVEGYGTITIELYYDKAPNTVKNFIYLANKGFYDGLTFHRVIEGFMIQGGDPLGTGNGGPGYSITGEFSANGIDNDLRHVRGVISMARTMSSYDSAGSQFFICQQDFTSGDGSYAAFGMILEGMDVVDAIAAVTTDASDKPVEDVVIRSVTVDTHGIAYDEPETLPG